MSIELIRYCKSEDRKHYYECCICRTHIQPVFAERCGRFQCECNHVFTKTEVIRAKDEYIADLERELESCKRKSKKADCLYYSEDCGAENADSTCKYHSLPGYCPCKNCVKYTPRDDLIGDR